LIALLELLIASAWLPGTAPPDELNVRDVGLACSDGSDVIVKLTGTEIGDPPAGVTTTVPL
jgi:hypothetical protein